MQIVTQRFQTPPARSSAPPSHAEEVEAALDRLSVQRSYIAVGGVTSAGLMCMSKLLGTISPAVGAVSFVGGLSGLGTAAWLLVENLQLTRELGR